MKLALTVMAVYLAVANARFNHHHQHNDMIFLRQLEMIFFERHTNRQPEPTFGKTSKALDQARKKLIQEPGPGLVSSVGTDNLVTLFHNAMRAEWMDNKSFPRPRLGSEQLNQFGKNENNQFLAGVVSLNNRRKEYRTLTADERNAFHDAIRQLKFKEIYKFAPKDLYDVDIVVHRSTMSPAAHFGRAFLPWHREFLFRIEQSLQAIKKGVYLPYWDSRLDNSVQPAHLSAIFSPDYLGNGNGSVRTGAFAYWPVYDSACAKLFGSVLMRDVQGGNNFFQDADIARFKAMTNYSEITTNRMTSLETRHGMVHAAIGGHMTSLNCAPNDPIFFMHHAFIDFIWEQFRQRQVTDKLTDYPADAEIGHHASDPMLPFVGMVNKDGLRKTYMQYYNYEPSPEQCSEESDCKSEILYCDLTNPQQGRCRSKVQENGSCVTSNSCYGRCRDQTRKIRCSSNRCSC